MPLFDPLQERDEVARLPLGADVRALPAHLREPERLIFLMVALHQSPHRFRLPGPFWAFELSEDLLGRGLVAVVGYHVQIATAFGQDLVHPIIPLGAVQVG